MERLRLSDGTNRALKKYRAVALTAQNFVQAAAVLKSM